METSPSGGQLFVAMCSACVYLHSIVIMNGLSCYRQRSVEGVWWF